MENWPVPTSATELRGFLGLTGYYRKFVPNYGIISKPLTQLLTKKGFAWSDDAQEAFLTLKRAMAHTPVLALPDFTIPFVIETDACDTGVGAVLMQNGHPLAYMSKALGLLNRKLSIYEKEFMAIIMAVDKWRQYLQRGPFLILTDHKSLCNLSDQQLTSDLQRKAMSKLIGLQFQFKFKRGVDNSAADSLSRVGHLMEIQTASSCRPDWVTEVLNSYNTDTEMQQLLQQLAVHSPDEKGYSLEHGLIKFNGRLVIGSNLALQTKLIATLHDSALGGHSGIQATYQRAKKLYYWPGMKLAVELFVRQCEVCQQAKHSNTRPAGLLQPLPPPKGAWQDITMDFMEGLPLSDGANVILVVVDRLTKYAHFLPLHHPYTAKTVAKVYVDQIVKLHGVPLSIISDRDRIFTSAFWKELIAAVGTKLHYSTAYHPQTDGQTERVNQCVEQYLRCAVQDQPKRWHHWLAMAEFWYNTSHHTALGCSPFKALYRTEPNFGALPNLTVATDSVVEETTADYQMHIALLREHLAQAHARMKSQADKHRSEREFTVGDQVLLKLQPYAQHSVVNRPYHKLAYKYFGPFPVLERIGTVAYKLDLPEAAQVHPVFHISQLKPFIPKYTPVFHEFPSVADLTLTSAIPEEILQRRIVRQGNAAGVQILVKWQGLPVSQATWEDYTILRRRFPAASLWAEDQAQEGASVTPLPTVPMDNESQDPEVRPTSEEGPTSQAPEE
jgi:hypothetical protein